MYVPQVLGATSHSDLARLDSTLSHLLTGADRTSSFLLLLSLGTSISMLLGSVFVRPALLHHSPILAVSRSPPDERSPLVEVEDDEDAELEEEAREAELRKQQDEGLNLSGWSLVKTLDFQIYWMIILLCSGCGLMCELPALCTLVIVLIAFADINNLGTLVVTLVPRDKDPREVAKLQASLVSLLSVFNCIGRLFSGFVGDYLVHHAPLRFQIKRVWLLGACSFCLLSFRSTDD